MNETSTAQWKVSGMDCSGCKLNIERVLAKLDGVSKGEVNFMAEQLEVEFDSQRTRVEAIEDAVKNLGFGLTQIVRSPKASQDNIQQKNPALNDTVFRERFVRIFQQKNSRHVVFAATLFFLGFFIAQWTGKSIPFIWPLLTLILGYPIFKKAFYGAKSGLYFSIEALMSLAVFGSIFIGASEEAAMVVVLFILGEWLESYAASRARKSIGQLLDLAPQQAWRISASGQVLVSVSDLRVGDLVEVKPGSRVPTDGVVVSGESQVDESLITGESASIPKLLGSQLTAGSLNFDGLLRFSVSSTIENNSLSQVIALVQKAEGSKAPTERFIERFSRIYTPIVVGVAAAVAILPPIVLQNADFATWIYRALGVLLIGCPCALVISVPASISAAIARGARLGLLIKSGAALETLAHAKSICFDKTGTVTEGKPSVKNVLVAEGWTVNEVVSLAATVAQGSEHPLAKSLLKSANETKAVLHSLNEATTQAGLGMSGTVEGRRVTVVSLREAQSRLNGKKTGTQNESARLNEESFGRTISGVLVQESDGWQLAGWISFEDQIKEDAPIAMAALKKLGFAPILLTGDSERASHRAKTALGIDGQSQLLPADKYETIKRLSKSNGPVIMVGDGINDAPALASADVGVAFSSGTEVAAERSDVVLMGEKVSKIVDLITLSRDTRVIVAQNIVFAVGLKSIFLVTTIFGFTGLWLAVISDTGATILVTLNALRILRWKPWKDNAV